MVSATNLVEIDLLRQGEPMPVIKCEAISTGVAHICIIFRLQVRFCKNCHCP
ncbi:DUF4058 family protein [Nostoc sp. FACHB-892]|nr:DUF4058 family protein [Nostoc sp. FACHB-892]